MYEKENDALRELYRETESSKNQVAECAENCAMFMEAFRAGRVSGLETAIEILQGKDHDRN